MSDRIKGFYVSLEKDIKDEDFECIKDAVLMIKGVLSVKESVSNSEDWFNRDRIIREITFKILDVIKQEV